MRAAPLVLLAALILVAALTAGDADAVDLAVRLAGPSLAHPFGTDHLGRDLAARLASGAFAALAVVALTTTIGLVAGAALGAAMALAPQPLDLALRRLADLMLVVPALIAALAAAAILGATPATIALALSLAGIAATAHLADGLAAAARAAPHVRAARALGGTPFHILSRHILPDVLPALVLVQGYHAARVLLAWSALTFLGLGGDTSRPDWGAMVWEYRLFLFDHPRLPLLPAAAIGVLAYAFARIGDPAAKQKSAGDGRAASG
jgi:ABC-type dipeptide/oligopeptide/nickel transport system permease subunit